MDKHNLFTISVLWLSIQLCEALSKNANIMQGNQQIFIWNKTMEDFRNPNGKTISEFNSDLLKPAKYYLENVTIRVIADNMAPYIKSTIRDSKIGGFLGDLWYILEEFLKFKSNITSMPDFDAGLIMISRHEADVYLAAAVHYSGLSGIVFSQPYFVTWYHLYFKLPEGTPSLYVHFQVFSLDLWWKIIAGYLLFTLMLWLNCTILKKLSKNLDPPLSPVTYFMGNISSFFNTGYDLKLKSYSARTQIFVAIVFGTLCYYALSASLVARLAVLDRPMPFNALQEVAEKKTHIMCVRSVSFVYSNFTDKNRTILPEWKGVLNTKACPDVRHGKGTLDIICRDNFVVFENRILMSTVLNNDRLACEVTFLPQRYFINGNFISLSTKFKGSKALKALITKMKSAGIIRKLENNWIFGPRKTKLKLRGANAITFNHVKGLIFIYTNMILFSIFLLVLEILYKKYWIVVRMVVANDFGNINVIRARKTSVISFRH